MKIFDEFKRVRTKEFWKEVLYWSSIKWSGKKTQPIAEKDWLPILTSALLGVLLILLITLIYKLL
jgi:hypothetical protein